MAGKRAKSDTAPKRGEQVSLHGARLEQVLKGLLKVPTPPEARSVKGVKKPGKKK